MTAMRSEASDFDRGLGSKLEVPRPTCHVQNTSYPSKISSGTQRPCDAMFGRQGRIDQTSCAGLIVWNGEQKKLNGNRQEVVGAYGEG